MKNLTFSQALEALKDGKYITREGWNGKGMYLWILPAIEVPKEWIKDPYLLREVNPETNSVHCEPAIRIKTAGGTVSTGWKPSNLDMFAEDWQVIEI